MSTLYLGFSGRAKHGKTESAETIKRFVESQGQTVGIYDFGSIVLRQAIAVGRLPAGLTRPECTKEQLQTVIEYGAEMRKGHENYWIYQIINAAKRDAFDVALCPNLRLLPEAVAWRSIGGKIVRCQRLNADGSLYISPDRDPNDITETALQFWPADAYITTVNGADAQLTRMLAVTVYKYFGGYTG